MANTTTGEKAGDVDRAQILNNITKELQRLPDNASRERVLHALAVFYGVSTPSVISRLGSVDDLVSGTGKMAFSNHPTISPKEFMAEKAPATDVERVACLAYYLTHYR